MAPGTVPATAVPGGQFDLWSVGLHEVGHALGVLSLTNPNGSGAQGFAPGSNDLYTVYDRYLQRGNSAPIVALINNPDNNTASFVGQAGNPSPDFRSDNLFWSGTLGTAANGGSFIRLSAPTTFTSSSVGHVDGGGTQSGAVMQPTIPPATARRRFQGYEIGMLLDIGRNTFNWNGTTGNWADGVSNLSSSRWLAPFLNTIDPGTNFFFNEGRALPPVGTITHNMVLTFGGTSGYTSTNNLPAAPFQLNRLNLSATGTSPTTVQGNQLRFGNDNGFNVRGQIHQNSSAPYTISNPIALLSTATPAGLTFSGTGSGAVAVSGPITGSGPVDLAGAYRLTLTGANTYAGGTAVSAGTLLANTPSPNSATGTGLVTVSSAGVLGGTGRVAGGVTLSSGGTLAPGDPTANLPGVLTVGGAVTLATGTTFRTQLNGTTAGGGASNYAQLVVANGGSIDLGGAALNALIGGGFNPSPNTRLAVVNNQNLSGGLAGVFAGLPASGTEFTIGAFGAAIYYGGDAGTLALTGGNDVIIAFTPIPEPAGLLLVGAALVALRRRAQAA